MRPAMVSILGYPMGYTSILTTTRGRRGSWLGAERLARRNDEAHTRRLAAQIERLGHTVHIDPAP